ncbi:MAG: AtpZ/AtpI family protein [Acetobacteraceae bacterium]|nr:AtpZ/AtpI family protein [Acetobacteraceae bacterium]
MTDQEGGSFEERLRAARARQAASEPKPARDTGTASPMGIGVRVGIELVSALAVGVAIGWGLDWWLGTRPWLLALFVLLGGAAGVANVWRLMLPHGSRRSPGQ